MHDTIRANAGNTALNLGAELSEKHDQDANCAEAVATKLKHVEAGISENSLPPGFKEYGSRLIGAPTMEKMINEAASITELNFLKTSVKILLTSHKDDDTIQRLQHEFGSKGKNDHYHFQVPFEESSLDNAPPLVLDVGGNIGTAAILFSRFHPEAQVITFEPNPYTYIYLLWNLHLNGVHILTSEEMDLSGPAVPGVYPVLGGLTGGTEYFKKMPMPALPAKSQIFKTVSDSSNSNDTKYVPIYSLSQFLQKHNLLGRQIERAKIDCECCEYLVLPANKEVFGNPNTIKHIVGELHPFEKCKDFFGLSMKVQDDVIDLLGSRGCTLNKVNGFIGVANPNRSKGEDCCPNFTDVCPLPNKVMA